MEEQKLSYYLNEHFSRRKVTVFVNGKEVPFGSEKHINELRKTMDSLRELKSCYKNGSSHRMVISQMISRLKAIINQAERMIETLKDAA